VDEGNVYDLILRSNKPNARAMSRWLTSEVVPQIRKTGSYIQAPDYPTALELYAKVLRDKDAASQRAIAAEAQITEMVPIVREWESYMDSTGTVDLGALAQALGGGRQRLVDRLRELGILVSLTASQRGIRPMQQYQDRGWFKVVLEKPASNVGP
jgi:phage antirepressor YoqD-like protein